MKSFLAQISSENFPGVEAILRQEGARCEHRLEEARKEIEVVAKLVFETRRIYVVGHTVEQYERFVVLLYRVRELVLPSWIPVEGFRKPRWVGYDGYTLCGLSPERAVLVLLDEWQRSARDDLKRQVVFMAKQRGFVPLET
jgi:hypothetical protein